MNQPGPTPTETMANSLAQVVDALALQAEAAIGYRTRLEVMGWSPAQAERIAAEFALHLNHAALKPPTARSTT